MLNKRTLQVIIVILALSNISVVSFMIWNRPPEPKNPKEIIETTLNLNEAQKKSFESLIPAHRKAMQKQHEQIFKLKKDLMMTLVDSDLSAQKEQLTEELGSALVQMDILRLNHLQDVYDLCSEEQRASFGKLITELESFIPPPPNPKIKKH